MEDFVGVAILRIKPNFQYQVVFKSVFAGVEFGNVAAHQTGKYTNAASHSEG